jgi:dipeptidyl aminopeptidase/acylaminoacyl peptidase
MHNELAQKNPVAAVFHGYVETSRDVSRVIDYLIARGDIDPARVGVAGWSGGGITSLMAACRDDRIRAVVAWKAGADFVQIMNLRGQALLMNQAMNDDSCKRELQDDDPIYHFRNIPPKALALIGNMEDPLMPRQGAQTLYDRLSPLYADRPDRLMIKFFDTPRPTHDLDPPALNLGCDWLIKFLAEPNN